MEPAEMAAALQKHWSQVFAASTVYLPLLQDWLTEHGDQDAVHKLRQSSSLVQALNPRWDLDWDDDSDEPPASTSPPLRRQRPLRAGRKA